MYNHTNEADTGTWTDGDRMKLTVFVDELELAEKILFIFFAICTILGNTLVLVATWRERSLHQPNKYFVACLAVADLLVGMIVEPIRRVYHLNLDDESIRMMSIHLCGFMMWIETFALVASIYTLTFISVDRYLQIRKPLQYRCRMTTSKSLKIIFFIGLISTAFSTYAATPHSGSSNELVCRSDDFDKLKELLTFLAVSAFFLPTLVILVMYALIFVVVHKRQKMLRNGELGQTCNVQNQRNAFLQDLKTIRVLLVVVGVFILCWCPFFVYKLLWYYYPNFIDWKSKSFSYWRRSRITNSVIHRLPYFNSLCNPIIYACLDQTYRAAFKKLFKRMMYRPSPRRRQPPEAIELPPLRRRYKATFHTNNGF